MNASINYRLLQTMGISLGIGALMFSLVISSAYAQSSPPLISRVNQALREANLPVTAANQQHYAARVSRGEIQTFEQLLAAMKSNAESQSLVQRVNEALRAAGLPVTAQLQQKYAAMVVSRDITTFSQLVSEMRRIENIAETRPLITMVNQALRVAGLPVTAELQQRFAARVAAKDITTFDQLVAAMRGGDHERPLTTVHTYFNNQNKLQTGQDECTTVFSTQRFVPRTEAVGRAALQQLLAGRTNAEREAGYTTSIPEGVIIQRLTISNGVARVDFNEALQRNVGGSCRVAAIRSQITSTLRHFPTVNQVVISINGRTEGILQP